MRWSSFPLLGREVIFLFCFGESLLALAQANDPATCFAKLRIASLIPVFRQHPPYFLQCESTSVRRDQFDREPPQQPRTQMCRAPEAGEFHDQCVKFGGALWY